MALRSRTAKGSRCRECAGYSVIELLTTMALLGFLAVLAVPVAGKWIRRSGDVSAYSTIRQVMAVARLEAVKRSANIVVEIGLTPDNRIRLRTFQDRANDTTSPLPGSSTTPPTDEALAAGNCVQDIGTFATSPETDEPTLGDVSLSPRIHFWKQGGSRADVADAVRFDTYLDISGSGNTSCGTSADRIVFLPTGGISVPQDSGSGPNPNTTNDNRGMYFADWQGKNFFRVTVNSDLSAKARVEKYVPGSGYVTSGWRWQ